MLKASLKLILILLCMAIFSACTTFNNMSTGRSLGKGNSELIPSLASFYAKGKMTPPILPQLIYNRGVAEYLDAGLNVSLGMIGAQARYQFIGDHRSEFCGAVGFSFTYFGSGIGNQNDEDLLDLTLTNFTLPLHLSWHPTDRLALYFSPKYSMLGGEASLVGSNSSGRVQLLGFTPGIEFGKKISYIMEINAIEPLRTNENFKSMFATFSMGVKFKW